jgi:hypothetical protein
MIIRHVAAPCNQSAEYRLGMAEGNGRSTVLGYRSAQQEP